jgi:hypothetical protein
VSVPDHVRAAALRAFEGVRPGFTVLPLVADSALDRTSGAASSDDARRIAFARGTTRVCVEVTYERDVTKLVVDVLPYHGSLEIEVLPTGSDPRPVVRGGAPLQLVTTATGPTSLAITVLDPDGRLHRLQTAWVSY